MTDYQYFLSIRAMLFGAIGNYLKDDQGHKSYEGAFELRFPCYFGGSYGVSLGLYCIGPSRHYEWEGKTLRAALKKCEYSIKQWIDGNDTDKGTSFCGMKTMQITIGPTPPPAADEKREG